MDRPPGEGPVEKRPATRIRTIMNGRIMFNNRSATLDCLVRNLSETGAKLEVSGAVTVPERFELDIPRKGVRRRARMVWRREGEMGVAFEDAAAEAPADESMADRVKRLEEENARLRARVAELVAQASEG